MPDLQTLIKYMKDDFLVEHVAESLEKMAAAHKNPNASVLHYGTDMDPDRDPKMIHDALSHHASHYKAALDKGNKPLANEHMKKFFNTMHMTEKLTNGASGDHSKGKLKIDAPAPNPWERNAFTNKNEQGKFKTDTKGWSRNHDNYADWLSKPPHSEHVNRSPHRGAYPLEEVKVNGQYLDIDPSGKNVDVGGNKANLHELDKHPIMNVYKEDPSSHLDSAHDKYKQDLEDYMNSPEMDSFYDKIEKVSPDRGSVKSKPVHGEPSKDIEEKPVAQSADKPEIKPVVQQVASQQATPRDDEYIKKMMEKVAALKAARNK